MTATILTILSTLASLLISVHNPSVTTLVQNQALSTAHQAIEMLASTSAIFKNLKISSPIATSSLKTTNTKPLSPTAIFNRKLKTVRTLAKNKDYSNVLKNSQDLLSISQTDTQRSLAHYWMAIYYLSKKDCASAKTQANLSVTLDASSSWAHNELGLTYACLNDKTHATTEFQNAVRLSTTNAVRLSTINNMKTKTNSTTTQVFSKNLTKARGMK